MGRRLRSSLLAGLIACVVTTPWWWAIAHASPEEAVAVVHLDGRGHGHGVGLSQWGAYTMAAEGSSATDILGRFYPGTDIGAMAGQVTVVVDSRPSVRVSLPQGGELRSAREGAQAEGFPIKLSPGQVVEIRHDGTGYRVIDASVQGAAVPGSAQRFRTAQDDECVLGVCVGGGDDGSEDSEGGDGQEPEPQPDEPGEPEPCTGLLCRPAPPTTSPEPTTTTTTTTTPGDGGDAPGTSGPPAPPSAPRSPTPIWVLPDAGGTVRSADRDRTYRGAFEVVGNPDDLRIRNHLDVEDYLKGMAEVPGHWPAAAVQAQAVAARTYALRAVAARGELCDSEACQVYVGVAHETPGQIAAVEATRGWVVTHRGALASTFYSASGGGFSATVQEGFGADYDIPYLPAAPYHTANPQPWAVDIALTDVAERLAYPGDVTEVRVTRTGPSGRPIAMELDGDAGVLPVDPQDFRRRLGLRSTLFTVRSDVLDAPPPPPPPPVDDQLTAARDSDQLRAIVDDKATLVDPSVESVEALLGDLAAGPGAPGRLQAATSGASGGSGAWAPWLALLALSVALTGRQLLVLGQGAGGDGLAGSVLGAPADGWRRQLASTLLRGPNAAVRGGRPPAPTRSGSPTSRRARRRSPRLRASRWWPPGFRSGSRTDRR